MVNPQQYQGTKCWSKIFINWLKEQKLTTCAGTQCLQVLIADLEYNRTQLLMILKNIRKLMTQSFSKLWNLLLSIPGIGPVNAITLISWGKFREALLRL